MLEKKTVSQGISSDYCRGWNDAVDAMPRWISVEERLPEKGSVVLVMWNYSPMVAHYRWSGYFETTWGCIPLHVGTEVTHWMSLPEPPKEPEA